MKKVKSKLSLFKNNNNYKKEEIMCNFNIVNKSNEDTYLNYNNGIINKINKMENGATYDVKR